MSNKNTFEKNGGYFIDGVAYMDCKITGEPVANVSTEAKSVIGSSALMGRMFKQFPETSTPKRQPTGRPAGWHFMNEFVDSDGNVFHKGVEQPKLKGTLAPSKVTPKKKTKRRTKEEILIARDKEKKAALRKAVKKQKDFLNHKFGDQVSKKNKKLDRAYFEKKKNPKYDDQEAYTKCCNQLKEGDHMMKGNKEDWKLIEGYIEKKLYEYPDTVSIKPIFCDECGRFKEYISEINLEKKW